MSFWHNVFACAFSGCLVEQKLFDRFDRYKVVPLYEFGYDGLIGTDEKIFYDNVDICVCAVILAGLETPAAMNALPQNVSGSCDSFHWHYRHRKNLKNNRTI